MDRVEYSLTCKQPGNSKTEKPVGAAQSVLLAAHYSEEKSAVLGCLQRGQRVQGLHELGG